MDISLSEELCLFAQELQCHLSPETLHRLAKDVGFVRRTSKYSGQDLVSLCVWLSQEVASASLNQLCSTLEAVTDVLISPQGLNERFNPAAVQLLHSILTELLQGKIATQPAVSGIHAEHFRRIRVLDSTVFQLPDLFADKYAGAGGSAHKAGVKIQFECDLLSGDVLHLHVGEGKENDQVYGSQCIDSLEKNDVRIGDLGYFSLEDFRTIAEKEAYFLSRLKLNTRIYYKNPAPEKFRNGTVKKHTEYIQIDVEQFLETLQPGETIELPKVYIGMYEKLPARVILYRLTELQMRSREKDMTKKEKKKGITYKEKSKRLSAINLYCTNIPAEYVSTNQIHDFYSLRWQIGILFKTWKSLFAIHVCKKVKLERLECHIYGQLIRILICSSTMFRMRELLLRKRKKELSEYKAVYMIQDYLPLLYKTIQQDVEHITSTLLRLYRLLEKNGRKSHRYEKKTVFDILGVVYERNKRMKEAA
ncbi:IS4 family transposase [Ectobacillus sp. JY-23]|uniref:IS4 family transposase n=1 Tax=Ectobacillus sp. JY-23 TaxID=2933872 RepID=UPI001FF6740B|nr:IS4 family transposase [Ectobacillus sp. JY-23]UOY92340.1 IS4 family transposase [Ectobacillus sp. JY-23]